MSKACNATFDPEFALSQYDIQRIKNNHHTLSLT